MATHAAAGAGAGAAAPLALPAYVARVPQGPYRSLAPMTKVVIGLAEAVFAFTLGAWTGPLLVLAVVLVSGSVAGALRGLAVLLLATLPIVGSIILINALLLPGATDVIAELGPLRLTGSGITFGLQVTARLLAASLALALVFLTTTVDDLLADLERRGLGRRGAFVVGAGLTTVPRMVLRAQEIVEAQRARGLDTEGRFWRRARGVLPLAGPLVFGALTDVEEQTMALEARAFSAPGRRTVLRVLPDSAGQRAVRWLLTVAALVAVLASLLRVIPLP